MFATPDQTGMSQLGVGFDLGQRVAVRLIVSHYLVIVLYILLQGKLIIGPLLTSEPHSLCTDPVAPHTQP